MKCAVTEAIVERMIKVVRVIWWNMMVVVEYI